jgi:hypothetical protein
MKKTTRGKRFLAALGIAILTASGIGASAHAAPAQVRSAAHTAPNARCILIILNCWKPV